MRLHLVNAPADSEAISPGSVALVFDRAAYESLLARGVHAFFADDLLDWQTRGEIEDSVAEVMKEIAEDAELAATRVEGFALVPSARNDLRIAVTNVLRTRVLVRALPGTLGVDGVVDHRCPAGVAAGAAAAIGLPHQVAASSPRQADPVVVRAANALLHAGRWTWRRDRVRVLAFPGAKVFTALRATDARVLRSLPLGVAAFPEIVGGGAAKLAARGIPAFVSAAARNASASAVSIPTPRMLADDLMTQAALQTIVEGTLRQTTAPVARAARSLAEMEVPGLRAVVLPSTSGASAAVVMEWARRRGATCAVVQHGIYGLRDWDAGDRDADVLLAWGAAVREQVSGPEVRIVGAPGVPPSAAAEATPDRRRILVATTSAPFGSALGPHGFCESFVACVRPAFERFLGAGFTIVLRPHPSENVERYRELLGTLANKVRISRSRPFWSDAAEAGLVVSSFSSVAVEAAALGRPVALWLGGTPLETRRRFVLPPFDRELPAAFVDQPGFERLADSLICSDGVALAEMHELSNILSGLARPFDADSFVFELAALAG